MFLFIEYCIIQEGDAIVDRRFEICNHYTKDTIKDFWRFQSKRRIHWKISLAHFKYLVIFAICLFLVLNILNILNPYWELRYLTSSPLWLFVLLLIIILWVVPYEAIMSYYKKLKDTKRLINTIVFYNDRMDVESLQSESKYYYSQLYKCYEVPEYFYIFIRADLFYIIEKSKFTIGDAAGLREFLEKEAGVKVIQKK